MNIKNFGAVGDGLNDDSTALQNAITSASGGDIFFPLGEYLLNQNVTIPAEFSISFEKGAKIVIPIGVSLVINGNVVAGKHHIFSISGSLSGINESCIEWFGGSNNGVVDNSIVITTMLNSGVSVISYGVGTYFHGSTISIPQNKVLNISGAGFRKTVLSFNNAVGLPLFNYARTVGQSGSICVFDNLQFVWAGTPKQSGSCAIKFYGYADGVDDNWLRATNCMFQNFEVAINTKWAGQCYFVDNFYQNNKYSHIMWRGSSFFYFKGCMSFDSTFIYASDPINDAYSNGLTIEDCNNITATSENVFVQGWQAVFIDKCGWDLGSGGVAALWFKNSQDVRISSCFISSNNSAPRMGVYLEGTHTYSINDNTIVNNSVGIKCTEPLLSLASKGVISSNKFDGNATNDILVMNNCEAVQIVNNHFSKQMSRTGSNYEVYTNIAGVNNCIISQNTFNGVTYPIVAGSNSIVSNNLFGVKV